MERMSSVKDRASRNMFGYVLTLETLLFVVLIVLPLLVGAMLLGRKLYTLYRNEAEFVFVPDARAVVWDSAGTPKSLGPVLGYDQYEAPLVLFRDNATKAGVLLGVRPTRLTSYGQVFYTNNTCTANPRLRVDTASVGTGSTAPDYLYVPVGFVYQMQGVSYAMGSGNVLYRSTALAGSPVTSNGADLFVWTSQDIAPATTAPSPPCAAVPNGTTLSDLVDTSDVVQVIDFDSGYTSPFRVTFPTYAGGPALPCATGEC